MCRANWYTIGMNTIHGIVFDFGGVISQAQDAAFFPAVNALTGWTRGQVLDGWKAHRRKLDADDLDAQGLYRQIAGDLGQTLPQATLDALAKLDYDSWSIPNPETLAWARGLKAAGLRIGILTNMPSSFIPWFDRCARDFRALADAEVISGLERIVKPNPEIYALMARRMALPPAELFFLDDTQANVDAARACGWHAERFLSVPQAKAALASLP